MTPSPAPAPSTAWRGFEFSLAGIPVLVRPYFILVAAFFGWDGNATHAALWVGIVFVSVLIHELGHAAAMRVFRFSPRIELHAMGGFTAWSQEKKPTAGQRVIVTICGPLAGLMLGAAAFIADAFVPDDADALLRYTLTQLKWANVVWSFINLLPILPWDGGLILDGFVELVAQKPVPKVAAVSSLLFGAAAIAFAIWDRSFIMLGYLGALGIWQGYVRFAPAKPADPSLDEVWALIQKHQFADAERLGIDRAVQSTDLEVRGKLYEAVAWSRLLRDDARGASLAIERMGLVQPTVNLRATLAAHTGRPADVLTLIPAVIDDARLMKLRAEALIALGRSEEVLNDAISALAKGLPSPLILQFGNALFEAGQFEPAQQVFLSGFDRAKEGVFLFNAACAQVKLGQLEPALATLGRAIEAGYAQRKSLLDDPDLGPLRTLPGWQALLGKLPA